VTSLIKEGEVLIKAKGKEGKKGKGYCNLMPELLLLTTPCQVALVFPKVERMLIAVTTIFTINIFSSST